MNKDESNTRGKKRKATADPENEVKAAVHSISTPDDVAVVVTASDSTCATTETKKNDNQISKDQSKENLDEIQSKDNTKATQNKKNSSNPYENIRHAIVTNNGDQENFVRLIGLKNLFAKQLPKMPKDYIVRLVFDRNHKSLAILSDDPAVKGTDEEIIGGICYRAYPEMRFSEIAFCAVNGNQQVKVRFLEDKMRIVLCYHHLSFIQHFIVLFC